MADVKVGDRYYHLPTRMWAEATGAEPMMVHVRASKRSPLVPTWPIRWLGHLPDDEEEVKLYGSTTFVRLDDPREWATEEPADHAAERAERQAAGSRY